MRRIALYFALTQIALALLMPTAFAADEQTMGFCHDGYEYKPADVSSPAVWDTDTSDGVTTEIDKTKQETILKDFYENTYKPVYSTSTEKNCGTVENTSTGYLEKGDCSREGKIVTELVEFNASNVTLDESNKVVTVYANSCCLIGYTDSEGKQHCDDVRTVYSTSYESCKDKGGPSVICQKRTWIIGTSGMSLLKLTVKYLYVWAAGIVGTVALLTIIYNGIKISLSGVSGDVSASKDKILQALMAIVLLFLSSLLLYTINPTFFG